MTEIVFASYTHENARRAELLTKSQCLKRKDSTWVKGYTRRGYRRSDGTLVKAARVKAHCRIYDGEEIGILARLKDRKPVGWYGAEKFREWRNGEKARVLRIIKNLPHKRLKEVEFSIYRVKTGRDPRNPAISIPIPSDYTIHLYDSAFSQSFNLHDIVIHEIAHSLYLSMNKQDRDRYLAVSQWSKEKSKDTHTTQRKGFVKRDGIDSPNEDFANNVESYFSLPGLLKKKNPDIHEWMKHYFK